MIRIQEDCGRLLKAALKLGWMPSTPFPSSANLVSLSWKVIGLVRMICGWSIHADCSQAPPSCVKVFQEDLFHDFPRSQVSMTGLWLSDSPPGVFWRWGNFCFSPVIGTLPQFPLKADSLAVTSASSQHTWMQPNWTQNHLPHSATIPHVLVWPFVTTVAVEVLLVAFVILARFNCRWALILLRQSLHAWAMFLNSLFAAYPWFYLLYYCLFALAWCHKFAAYPSQSPDRSTCFPEYQEELFLWLEEVVLKDLLLAFRSSFALQGCLPWDPAYWFSE